MAIMKIAALAVAATAAYTADARSLRQAGSVPQPSPAVPCTTAADCTDDAVGMSLASCFYEWTCNASSNCEQVYVADQGGCCESVQDCVNPADLPGPDTRLHCSDSKHCLGSMRAHSASATPCDKDGDCPPGNEWGSTWECVGGNADGTWAGTCKETPQEGGCLTSLDCDRPDAALYPNCWAVCEDGECGESCI